MRDVSKMIVREMSEEDQIMNGKKRKRREKREEGKGEKANRAGKRDENEE